MCKKDIVTWKRIARDFRQRHPTLAKQMTSWDPHDYATILVRLKNGAELTYDYDTHKAKFIKYAIEEIE